MAIATMGYAYALVKESDIITYQLKLITYQPVAEVIVEWIN
ncbi:MAG: hypothetical protein V7K61_19210 [Nostoc sp.]